MQKSKLIINIVGLVKMGEGITQTIAPDAYKVPIFDSYKKNTKHAVKTISYHLKKLVEKRKISPKEGKKILKRKCSVKNLSDLSGIKLIIESIIEDLILKKNIFVKLKSIIL